jgi:hypothetical protein
MADNDVFFCTLLERILASSYELVMAEDGAEAWQLNVRKAEARPGGRSSLSGEGKRTRSAGSLIGTGA